MDFADQAFYGQESKLDITDVNTKCSYQYCLSNKELLESEWTTTQLEHNATGYTVNSSAFENAEWKDVSDGFELSDKEGTWYLYVKVEADRISVYDLSVRFLHDLSESNSRYPCLSG